MFILTNKTQNMFAVENEGKTFIPFVRGKEGKDIAQLPPGFYEFERVMHMMWAQPTFKLMELENNLIPLKGKPFDSIVKEIINQFSEKNRKIYKDLKIKNSLAALLYGPPGTGKTSFSLIIGKILVERFNAIVIKVKPEDTSSIKSIVKFSKDGNSDQLVVIIMDEFDQFIYNGRFISDTDLYEIQELLDGTYTENDILYLMTTNHLEKIPDSLKDRPSRIRIIEEIKFIPPNVAINLVEGLIPEEYKEFINIKELGYKIGENPIKIDQIKHIALDILTGNYEKDKAVDKAIKKFTKQNSLIKKPNPNGEE